MLRLYVPVAVTVLLIGGLTFWESIYSDQGNDVAVIAQVDSFIRDDDTGARGVVWMGTYFQSTGATPADCAHAVAGKWRIGLETTRAALPDYRRLGPVRSRAMAGSGAGPTILTGG